MLCLFHDVDRKISFLLFQDGKMHADVIRIYNLYIPYQTFRFSLNASPAFWFRKYERETE